jgi:hypothetical protein
MEWGTEFWAVTSSAVEEDDGRGGYSPVIFLVCVVAFGAVSPKPWELSPGGSVLPVL